MEKQNKKLPRQSLWQSWLVVICIVRRCKSCYKFNRARLFSVLVAQQVCGGGILVNVGVATQRLKETVVVFVIVHCRYLANHAVAILRPELMIHIRLETDALTLLDA